MVSIIGEHSSYPIYVNIDTTALKFQSLACQVLGLLQAHCFLLVLKEKHLFTLACFVLSLYFLNVYRFILELRPGRYMFSFLFVCDSRPSYALIKFQFHFQICG